MLVKFGAKNFYCFKEKLEISLELDGNCPQKISRGNSISNLLCIKGANASGKTRSLRILGFLKDFCTDSFGEKPDSKINIVSFFSNNDPIHLFCEFLNEKELYRYELILTDSSIIHESLTRTVKKKSTLFVRTGNEVTSVAEFSGLKSVKLRSNASIISTAHQYEVQCIAPIYAVFDLMFTNVAWHGKVHFYNDYRVTSRFYKEHADYFSSAKKIIREFDLGIKDVLLKRLKNEAGKDYYYPVFTHKTETGDEQLIYHYESLGTKTLYHLLPLFLQALSTGSLLVLDEFDMDLHPMILESLIRLFDDKKTNPFMAQLIFTTHCIEILDYMGKYRNYIINKKFSESYGYRLDEIPGDLIRNDRTMVPLYKSGRIGGIPEIG